jgi:AraC-like DNA-binding protein
MKLQLEEIHPDENSSFRLMVNPRLSDFFYWHFHPEYELVYIEGTDGTRHVGEHLSRFTGSDLVFIGSYVPHLNFDYGVKTDYEKRVLHIRPDFLNATLANLPELKAVYRLFELAQYGIAFSATTQSILGERLKNLHLLPHFQQFLEILDILQILATATDYQLLHPEPVKNQYTRKDQDRLQRVYRFLDEHYQRKIEIAEVAELCHFTNAAFCRYFKKMTRLTFVHFLNLYRVNEAKRLLMLDKNVTETCFSCGFESLSYFNRTFKAMTGENPLAFKRRYSHQNANGV